MLSLALVTKLEGKTHGSKNQGKTNTVYFFILFLTPVTAYAMQKAHEGRFLQRT